MSAKRLSAQELAAMTPHEAASYWFVRRDAQDLTEDCREFENWLDASEEHRSAYEQTDAMWKCFEELADESELRALQVAALVASPAPNVWPRAGVIAASLVAGAMGIAALIWHVSGSYRSAASSTSHGAVGEYVTAHNQRSTVRLTDGTMVSMNLDTVFNADFASGQRLIRLTKGQAFFDVARDPARPFIVTAADRHINALGTKFDVRLDGDRVEVVLVEGRVSVDRSDPPLLDRIVGRSAHVVLEPNQRLVVAPGEPVSVTPTDALRVTSWREGWIVFEDETVEFAVAELNRYSDRPIVVPEDAVRQMRLSGVFRIGQPDRFGAIIQELLPVAAKAGGQGETVLVLEPDASEERLVQP